MACHISSSRARMLSKEMRPSEQTAGLTCCSQVRSTKFVCDPRRVAALSNAGPKWTRAPPALATSLALNCRTCSPLICAAIAFTRSGKSLLGRDGVQQVSRVPRIDSEPGEQ